MMGKSIDGAWVMADNSDTVARSGLEGRAAPTMDGNQFGKQSGGYYAVATPTDAGYVRDTLTPHELDTHYVQMPNAGQIPAAQHGAYEQLTKGIPGMAQGVHSIIADTKTGQVALLGESQDTVITDPALAHTIYAELSGIAHGTGPLTPADHHAAIDTVQEAQQFAATHRNEVQHVPVAPTPMSVDKATPVELTDAAPPGMSSQACAAAKACGAAALGAGGQLTSHDGPPNPGSSQAAGQQGASVGTPPH
jgi:hypothetical protein